MWKISLKVTYNPNITSSNRINYTQIQFYIKKHDKCSLFLFSVTFSISCYIYTGLLCPFLSQENSKNKSTTICVHNMTSANPYLSLALAMRMWRREFKASSLLISLLQGSSNLIKYSLSLIQTKRRMILMKIASLCQRLWGGRGQSQMSLTSLGPCVWKGCSKGWQKRTKPTSPWYQRASVWLRT